MGTLRWRHVIPIPVQPIRENRHRWVATNSLARHHSGTDTLENTSVLAYNFNRSTLKKTGKIYKIVSNDFSSVSSGSSRASYLSDSLRLSALTEERSVEDSFNYHHVDRVVDELIQTEFTYLESLNELIHVSTEYLGIFKIITVKIRSPN